MGKHSKSKPDDIDEQNPKSNKGFERKPNSAVIWFICSIGIFVVSFSLISVVFPGLIISIVDTNLFGEQEHQYGFQFEYEFELSDSEIELALGYLHGLTDASANHTLLWNFEYEFN